MKLLTSKYVCLKPSKLTTTTRGGDSSCTGSTELGLGCAGDGDLLSFLLGLGVLSDALLEDGSSDSDDKGEAVEGLRVGEDVGVRVEWWPPDPESSPLPSP